MPMTGCVAAASRRQWRARSGSAGASMVSATCGSASSAMTSQGGGNARAPDEEEGEDMVSPSSKKTLA